MANPKPSDAPIMMSPCDPPVSILKSSSSWSSFPPCEPSGMVRSPVHGESGTNPIRPARKVSFERVASTDALPGMSSLSPCTPDHTACFYASKKGRHMKVKESSAPPPPPVPAWRLMEDMKATATMRAPPHRPVPQRPPISPQDCESSHLYTVDNKTPTKTVEWTHPSSNLFFPSISSYEEESKSNSPSPFRALERPEDETPSVLLHWDSLMTSDTPPPLVPALRATAKRNIHHSLSSVDFEQEAPRLSKKPPKLQMRLMHPNRPLYGL